MFDSLPVLPPDSILGLAAACRADPNPDKVDLTLGVYMDETGLCPVFEAVQEAQQALVSEEQTKVYMPPQGDPDYLNGIRSLVFGEAGMADLGDRTSAVQTPGGCGAVRLGAEVLHAAAPDATVWVSDPTWPVHIPLMGSVGLQFKTYRYYSAEKKGLDFEAMLADLEAAQAGDVVLLHGCCHNPSGVDPTLEQWGVLADLMSERQLLPMIDFAYQGMGAGLDEDAAVGALYLDKTDHVPQVDAIIVHHCTVQQFVGRPQLFVDSNRIAPAPLEFTHRFGEFDTAVRSDAVNQLLGKRRAAGRFAHVLAGDIVDNFESHRFHEFITRMRSLSGNCSDESFADIYLSLE